MTSEEARKVLDDAAAAVAEHFQSVIIVATRDNPECERYTELLTVGRGNWYAQRASIEEVLRTDDAMRIAYQHRKEQERGEGGL